MTGDRFDQADALEAAVSRALPGAACRWEIRGQDAILRVAGSDAVSIAPLEGGRFRLQAVVGLDELSQLLDRLPAADSRHAPQARLRREACGGPSGTASPAPVPMTYAFTR